MRSKLVAFVVIGVLALSSCAGSADDESSVVAQPEAATSESESPSTSDGDDQDTTGVPVPVPAEQDDSTGPSSSDLLGAGIFSVSYEGQSFSGKLDSCTFGGGSDLIETVFQAQSEGTTVLGGESVSFLVGQYLQDLDGDGTVDTTMQFRLEVGDGNDVSTRMVGTFNDSASSPQGNMLATITEFDTETAINGGGEVNDFSGMLAPAEETIFISFIISCQ